MGDANSNISSSYSGWIDLFGWGTSGYDHGANCYQPWSTSQNNNDYFAYGQWNYNLYDQTGQADWGYNAISNGGNSTNTWRTPTHEEWVYVFNTRTTTSGIRYAKAEVNNVNGVILLPDDWSSSYYSLSNTNQSGASFTSNTVTASQWSTLEQHGAVFLPAAGYRSGTSVSYVGSYGTYWSASYYNSNGACYVCFYDGSLSTDGSSYRYFGQSVRLVAPAEGYTFNIDATPNPAEGGTVTGAGSYAEGATCTLTATANEGYTFINWTENGEIVSTEAIYSFTVAGDRNLVANFTHEYHWEVNINDYAITMTITGIIRIDGVEQTTNTLEIGAFCDNECRGRELLSDLYYPTLGHCFVFLSVYGNDGDNISFRLYDHALGEDLDLTCASITFVTNAIYGTAVDPYIFDFSLDSITQVTSFGPGWNWWSSYVQADDLLDQLETGLGNDGYQIKSQNAFVNNYDGMWMGVLTSVNNESTYLILTTNGCEVELTGMTATPADHPITLNKGWNWIGYPNSVSVSITNAFSNFTPADGDQVKSQNSFSSYFNGMWIGNLQTLQPGLGLFYMSNSNGTMTLVFPEANRSGEPMEIVTDNDSHWTANYHAYQHNMTVTAVVELDDLEVRSEEYELSAFVGNECRGSVKLMYVEPIDRYVAFLLICGDAEEDMRFVLTHGTETSTSDDVFRFIADETIGTIAYPTTIHFGTLGVDDNQQEFVHVFPNPSKGVFNIEGNGIMKIEVVNALGQIILSEEVNSNHVQIDLKDKASGLYLLRVITNNDINSTQIIKE